MINSRDISKLRSDVAANCRLWLERCKAEGLNVLITNTVRDKEYQAYLYEQGRSRPGAIVTKNKVPTFHSVNAGLAFDFCKNVKGHEFDDPAFFKKAASIAKEMGFSWGGDWSGFVDMPHIQWDNKGKWTGDMILAGKLPPLMPLYKSKESDDMTEAQFYSMFKKSIEKYNAEQGKQPVSSWAKTPVAKAKKKGILDGTTPRTPLTREQAAVILDRLGLLD